ncbi:MAG: thiamine pyrophosphate-binding protein [Mobilicoccus sp.]|nr:thiamine pyrophosphate-binding protein [Mobilicoccus sp.]
MVEEHTTTEAHEIPTSQMDSGGPTGGDILVELMRAEGVEVAFGVISIHNAPLVEAVDRDLRFVPVRHEAAAVNAADGYARATGRIGVALTSTGTGAGNAAGAMLEALTAGSRVLHVTGNVDSTFLGENRGVYHEVPRQLEMLGAVSGTALRIERASHARRVLTEAVHGLAAAPHQPVSVDWPIDLQYTADPRDQVAVTTSEPRRKTGAKRDIERAARVLSKAQRPLIWAGGGATRVGPALTRLAEMWGAGVLTGANGRGSVPEDHPLLIGNFTTTDELRGLIEQSDCLLTVGSHLRGHETQNFQLPLPENHVQIDLESEGIGRNYPVTVGLHADTIEAIPALLDALSDLEVATHDGWADQVRTAAEAARAAHRTDIGAYVAICDSIRSRLPRAAPLVRDVTIPGSSWGNRLLAVYDPTTNVFAAGGGIGQGLAMAIGAGVAAPDVPTLAMVGDGGLAVHLGELATLAGEGPQVVLVVFNDGGYGVLRHMQTERGADRRGVDLMTPNLSALADAFGLPHARVGDPEAFDDALAAALRRTGPSVIEIDVPALDPQPAPFVPPVNVP